MKETLGIMEEDEKQKQREKTAYVTPYLIVVPMTDPNVQ